MLNMSVLCFAGGALAGKITGFSVPDTGKWRVFSGDEEKPDAGSCVGKVGTLSRAMLLPASANSPCGGRKRHLFFSILLRSQSDSEMS